MARPGLMQRYKVLELNKLVKADWNYKTEDSFKKKKLIENIKRNGQIENILVRLLDTGYWEVVNGNHRYDALVDMGKRKVVVYDLGEITQEQAIRIAIETNETKFDSDQVRLSELVSELEGKFGFDDLLETLPYTEDELQDLVDMGNFDWDDLNKDDHKFEEDEFKTISIKVPQSIYDLWKEWKDKASNIMGYDSEAKALEFAIVEALNIPEESLGQTS